MYKSKYVLPVLLLLGAGTALSARHHHNEGVHLAAEIVGLVRTAVAPPPVVVAPPPVVAAPPPVVAAPPPVVVAPPPVVIPNYGYGWWQGVWVPCYNNWYWYRNSWVWGGRGPRPVPPRWVPDFRRRPMPPPPRVHHPRPAPPPVHHRPAPPRVHHRPAPPPVHYRPAPPPPRHHHPAPGPQRRGRW